MKLYEYQTKMRFKDYGIPIPKGVLVTSLDEARQAVDQFGDYVILKPQSSHLTQPIRIAKRTEDAFKIIEHIIQTNLSLMTIRNILIEQGIEVKQSIYITLRTDSNSGHILLKVDSHDGHNKTIKQINSSLGLRGYQARDIAGDIDLPRHLWQKFIAILQAAYQCYVESDAKILEINPLAINYQDKFVVLNAHMNIDNNALFRHPEFFMVETRDQRTPSEQKALQANISYNTLDGQIACIANGAGLCLATMDNVHRYGGGNIAPACFADIGSSARAEHIDTAIRLALSEKHVKSILINIFGGITQCSDVANDILKTYEGVPPQKNIIIRLAGPKADEAIHMLQEAAIPNVIITPVLSDAVRFAISAARKETYGNTR